MKNENDFNKFLSKELRKLGPSLFALKASDKFSAGVSDFLTWYNCHSTVIESKFVRDWPSDRAKLLQHTFTGPQRTFMESVELAGCRGIGLVGIGSEKRFFVVDFSQIPEGGNWKTWDFKKKRYSAYPFQCVPQFVEAWL